MRIFRSITENLDFTICNPGINPCMSLEMEKKKVPNEKHGKEQIKKCVHDSEEFHLT